MKISEEIKKLRNMTKEEIKEYINQLMNSKEKSDEIDRLIIIARSIYYQKQEGLTKEERAEKERLWVEEGIYY